MTVEATGPSGAPVTYTATATPAAGTTLLSTVCTPTPMAAWSLRHLADRFDDLCDLAPRIERARLPIAEAVS